jgi:hypothetical protein
LNRLNDALYDVWGRRARKIGREVIVKSGEDFRIRREQLRDIGRCEDIRERNLCADSEKPVIRIRGGMKV